MQEQLLVVEDDLVLQLSLTTMLRREGYTIYAVRGVAEAEARLLEERPAVVLLALSLPDGGSFNLLSLLRGLADPPLVIVSTTSENINEAVEAIRQGAFDYLIKPFNSDLLRAALRRATEHHALRQQAREIERLRAAEETMRANVRSAAHHISQHLTVIMGESQLLYEELTDAEARMGLERILRATEEAARTLSAMRSARGSPARESLSPDPTPSRGPAQEG